MITDYKWLKRMLSHNVRMPMSVITGYGELLKQGLLSRNEMEDAIYSICENINYMNNIMKIVLDDETEELMAEEVVDVVALMYRMKNYVSEIASKIPIKIIVKAEAKKMFVRAESVALMRIIYQLFENALKYGVEGDSIMIQIYQVEKEQILIVFKDNGKGMEEREVPRIFEKGFRGKNSKVKSGTGYGLYDVKQLVERYGGSIEVSSKENYGFSVYMLFPSVDASQIKGSEQER